MTTHPFNQKLLTDDQLREVADNPTDSMLFSIYQPSRSGWPTKDLLFERHGKWLVAANVDAPGEHCWYDSNGQGCGGNNVDFKMVDGSIVTLKGPWHGNTDSLFEDTGFDIRDRHWRRYVISIERRRVPGSAWNGPDEMVGVLEANDGIMRFDRPQERAQEIANLLGRKVYVSDISAGGGGASWAKPQNQKEKTR